MDSVVAVWHSYIADLDDREFERQIDVIYRNAPTIVSVWNMIFHVFNHVKRLTVSETIVEQC